MMMCAVVLTSCGLESSTRTARVIGVFQIDGGMYSKYPVRVAGVVTLKGRERSYTQSVGPAGHFLFSVAPGRYTVTGHTVRLRGCQGGPVRAETGRTSHVTVVCELI